MSNRNCFVTYMECDEGAIFTRNDTSYPMVGIGSVMVSMFDGVIRTIMDVMRVQKNL